MLRQNPIQEKAEQEGRETMNPPPKPNDSKPVWELVIEDMHARDQFGREKYHTPLQMGNGRDHAKDAYEEVLDLAVYMKQVIIERAELLAEVERLRAENEALRSDLSEAKDSIQEYRLGDEL